MAVPAPPRQPAGVDPSVLENPRGTLAIVIVFGLLFALAWLAMFIFGFLGRGATHH
jgi:hypothetical protein